MANDDNNNGPGIGTAIGTGVLTSAGTAGAALANGAYSAREKAHEKLEKAIDGVPGKDGKEGTKGLKAAREEALTKLEAADHTAINVLSKDQELLKKVVGEEKAKVEGLVLNPKQTHQLIEEAKKLEEAKLPAGIKKDQLSSLGEKLKAIVEHEGKLVKAEKGLESTKALQAAWKEASWAERLTKSIEHSPKKIALIAAPLIAAGAFLSINAFSGRNGSDLSDDKGQSK